MSTRPILATLRSFFRGGRWLQAPRPGRTLPASLAGLDARTLRDIGAPDAWQHLARERRARDERALSLDTLRARGVFGT